MTIVEMQGLLVPSWVQEGFYSFYYIYTGGKANG